MSEKRVLTKSDITKLFIRSNAIQGAFNFETMQGMGFEWAMLPILDKLYTNPEDRKAAYKRHIGYFNSHPWLVGPIFGMTASMEERMSLGEDVSEENIQAVKGALMGPLAGIGDSLLWGTLRPIFAGVCASLALAGNSFAPILFAVGMNAIHFLLMYWGVSVGYNFADTFMDKMEGLQIKVWMEAATILGLLVVGGLTATWLNVTTKLEYTIGEASISLQSTLDQILPKMLPLVCVLCVYAALRKGKSTTFVMVAICVFAFILGFFGIM